MLACHRPAVPSSSQSPSLVCKRAPSPLTITSRSPATLGMCACGCHRAEPVWPACTGDDGLSELWNVMAEVASRFEVFRGCAVIGTLVGGGGGGQAGHGRDWPGLARRGRTSVTGVRRSAMRRVLRCLWPGSVYTLRMAPNDDDDDWVGVPPEGRYSRDRAKPEFWRNRWPLAGAGMAVVLIILAVALIVRWAWGRGPPRCHPAAATSLETAAEDRGHDGPVSPPALASRLLAAFHAPVERRQQRCGTRIDAPALVAHQDEAVAAAANQPPRPAAGSGRSQCRRSNRRLHIRLEDECDRPGWGVPLEEQPRNQVH